MSSTGPIKVQYSVISVTMATLLSALFQGFARRSGIQVFRLYARPSPVTEIANGKAGLRMGGVGGTEKICPLHAVVVLWTISRGGLKGAAQRFIIL